MISVQGVQGVQGSVQGGKNLCKTYISRLLAILCRVCRVNVRARTRKLFLNHNKLLKPRVKHLYPAHPAHPAHSLIYKEKIEFIPCTLPCTPCTTY
jgi:hypothetical protein